MPDPFHLPASLPSLTLVLGGARSGKSAFAESLALQSGLEPVYIATCQPFDSEMQDRIARHRQSRDDRWKTVEEPLQLLQALQTECAPERIILVDCLTLWVTNLLLNDRDCEQERETLLSGLAALPGPVLLVSNETGLGIVPDNALSRRFRDQAGWLNQAIAARAGKVYLLVAGLPLEIKPGLTASQSPFSTL